MRRPACFASVLIAFGFAAPFAAPATPAAAADYSGPETRVRERAVKHVRTYRKAYVVRTRGPTARMERDFTGALPACDDPAVLGHLSRRFVTRERGYWGSDLELAAFGHVRELGYRSWGAEFIPRRFCSAKTMTTDHRQRRVYYEIGEGFAFAGVGWDVNWCVTGLDYNLAYAPACKMARP